MDGRWGSQHRAVGTKPVGDDGPWRAVATADTGCTTSPPGGLPLTGLSRAPVAWFNWKDTLPLLRPRSTTSGHDSFSSNTGGGSATWRKTMAKARVLTRSELAEHLGVDKQVVTKWERSGMPVHHRGRRRGVPISSTGGPDVAKGAGSRGQSGGEGEGAGSESGREGDEDSEEMKTSTRRSAFSARFSRQAAPTSDSRPDAPQRHHATNRTTTGRNGRLTQR